MDTPLLNCDRKRERISVQISEISKGFLVLPDLEPLVEEYFSSRVIDSVKDEHRKRVSERYGEIVNMVDSGLAKLEKAIESKHYKILQSLVPEEAILIEKKVNSMRVRAELDWYEFKEKFGRNFGVKRGRYGDKTKVEINILMDIISPYSVYFTVKDEATDFKNKLEKNSQYCWSDHAWAVEYYPGARRTETDSARKRVIEYLHPHSPANLSREAVRDRIKAAYKELLKRFDFRRTQMGKLRDAKDSLDMHLLPPGLS